MYELLPERNLNQLILRKWAGSSWLSACLCPVSMPLNDCLRLPGWIQTVMNTSVWERVVLPALNCLERGGGTSLSRDHFWTLGSSHGTVLRQHWSCLWMTSGGLSCGGWDWKALFAVVPFLSLWMVSISIKGYRRVPEGLSHSLLVFNLSMLKYLKFNKRLEGWKRWLNVTFFNLIPK